MFEPLQCQQRQALDAGTYAEEPSRHSYSCKECQHRLRGCLPIGSRGAGIGPPRAAGQSVAGRLQNPQPFMGGLTRIGAASLRSPINVYPTTSRAKPYLRAARGAL